MGPLRGNPRIAFHKLKLISQEANVDPDMDYQVTIRYGKKTQRYLTLSVRAPHAAEALRLAADGIPEEIIPEVDLVELRDAPDFDKTFSSQNPP